MDEPADSRFRSGEAIAEGTFGRLARAFGVDDEERRETVSAMLADGPRTAAGYWLQLMLAMAIATLGLVLGSTAVVIGAMLVSPLMRPILAFGMGLAVGSPLLVLRSSARVVASVIAVTAAAAAITVLLPFHEMTSEIASRTTPTVLDLAIASCCAAAGVYASIRRGSDTASTAAGTAIGIALVPPLCVVGYALGTRALDRALGAALLFTANFCAILLFAVLGFLLLGYGRVDVTALERKHLEEVRPSGLTARLARRLSVFFRSRLGPAVRIVMPVVLVLAVSVPLRSALAEVTWEVRVRKATREALRSLSVPTVHSNLLVERRQLTLTVVALASVDEARRIEAQLKEELGAATGGTPSIEVLAVADARALSRAESALRERTSAQSAQAAMTARAQEADALATLTRKVEEALRVWPEESAGPRVATGVVLDPSAPRVEVLHIGAALAPPGEQLLASVLSAALGRDVQARTRALPGARVVLQRGDERAWLVALTEAVGVVGPLGAASEVRVCLEVPARPDAGVRRAEANDAALFAEVAPFQSDPRVVVREASAFAFFVSADACRALEPANADVEQPR
jgi:uncharacterized hydrophobic protein (TIGR00271 family)